MDLIARSTHEFLQIIVLGLRAERMIYWNSSHAASDVYCITFVLWNEFLFWFDVFPFLHAYIVTSLITRIFSLGSREVRDCLWFLDESDDNVFAVTTQSDSRARVSHNRWIRRTESIIFSYLINDQTMSVKTPWRPFLVRDEYDQERR